MTIKHSNLRACHEAIIKAWECVVKGEKVLYISGPITTGRRYVDALKHEVKSRVWKREIRELNVRDLQEAAILLRQKRNEIVVEPGSLNLVEWDQADYHLLWKLFIEQHVHTVAFLPGWEFSVGCTLEYIQALKHEIPRETFSGDPLPISDASRLMSLAIEHLGTFGNSHEASHLRHRLIEIHDALPRAQHYSATFPNARKDQSLDILAEQGFNIAQFISFSPSAQRPKQELCRIAGIDANFRFSDTVSAINKLLEASNSGAVNVRSFEPSNPQSREFIYGLKSISEVTQAIERLSREGLHTIVNETIDVHDGGVSGVIMGDIIEFAPDDTPRCVEKPGTASLPTDVGLKLLSTVYGFPIEFEISRETRLEFSVHPRPVGWKQTNTVAWEMSSEPYIKLSPKFAWPNAFSRMIGDKVFGLLVADCLGLPVPRSVTICRRVAPFTFGRNTGRCEQWLRTAPSEQMPGLFSTTRGWTDPFELLQREDPSSSQISSVIAQQGVRPYFSGAVVTGADGKVILEGLRGPGDGFMLGTNSPEPLPLEIEESIIVLYGQIESLLGPVRFEWVHDGEMPWIVQLHRGATSTSTAAITDTVASKWTEFDTNEGLVALRRLLTVLPPDTGILLKGNIGLTSHIADVIRKAGVAARMVS